MSIDEDIRRASTLPSRYYTDARELRRQIEALFAPSWQLTCDVEPPTEPETMVPWTLLPGCLDEPLLTVCDANGVCRHVSNVCTHRGNLLVKAPCKSAAIRCGYHGRRFGLDGKFLSMPEFEGAEDFPRPEDDLPQVHTENWGPLQFVSLRPERGFGSLFAPVLSRLDWAPVHDLEFDAASRQDYIVDAHWALYCENYLEGFHIPYVHPSLARALDYQSYTTEVFDRVILQTGVVEDATSAFEGTNIGGYYFFVFPNLMLNVYPWGISINVVVPLGPSKTRVRFLPWVWDPKKRDVGAGAGLHQVELEDEAIVESVQRGVRARLYDRGRYSPEREKGMHAFHRLISALTA